MVPLVSCVACTERKAAMGNKDATATTPMPMHNRDISTSVSVVPREGQGPAE